jgi:hypothetical protein
MNAVIDLAPRPSPDPKWRLQENEWVIPSSTAERLGGTR